MFALIGAIEKFSIEELDTNHSKNELKGFKSFSLGWNIFKIVKRQTWNRMYTMRMLKTFLSEITTQSKTALSLGIRLIVFKGLRTRRSFRDFSLCPVGVPLLDRRSFTSWFNKLDPKIQLIIWLICTSSSFWDLSGSEMCFQRFRNPISLFTNFYHNLRNCMVEWDKSTRHHSDVHDIPKVTQVWTRM